LVKDRRSLTDGTDGHGWMKDTGVRSYDLRIDSVLQQVCPAWNHLVEYWVEREPYYVQIEGMYRLHKIYSGGGIGVPNGSNSFNTELVT